MKASKSFDDAYSTHLHSTKSKYVTNSWRSMKCIEQTQQNSRPILQRQSTEDEWRSATQYTQNCSTGYSKNGCTRQISTHTRSTRLMATVISELWQREDRSLMIMPGKPATRCLPSSLRINTIFGRRMGHSNQKDIDGENALPLRMIKTIPTRKIIGYTSSITNRVYGISPERRRKT